MIRPRLRTPSGKGFVVVTVVVLVGLAWQGRRLTQALPEFERVIDALGPWGPVMFCLTILVLAPLFVPDTLFGIVGGAVFGLWWGVALYFGSVYVSSLMIHAVASHWLSGRITPWIERRPKVLNLVNAAKSGGAGITFWIRMIPVNPAIVSYGLGAVGVPFRDVAIGTLGLFPHMFATVYLGSAAAQVAEMAAHGQDDWRKSGVVLVLACVALAGLAWQVGRIARAKVNAPAAPNNSDVDR